MRRSIIIVSLFLIALATGCVEDADGVPADGDGGPSGVNEGSPEGGDDAEEVRVLGEAECISAQDCERDEECFLPGVPNCGTVGDPGQPGAASCQDDADCEQVGEDLVCDSSREPPDCSGVTPLTDCVEKCESDDDCSALTFCEDSGHCLPRPSCAGEDDCEGFCVKGLCLEVPGSCGDIGQ